MPTQSTAIEHLTRRLIIALPEPYDEARAHYETLVPEVDSVRFLQRASWQATLELAEISAPHGFMRYYRGVALSGAPGVPLLPLRGALGDRYARQPVIVRWFFAHRLAALVCLLPGPPWLP